MTKIGIIGAGQLGQMLGYAAKAIDAECIFLDPNKNSPAKSAGKLLNYAFDDIEGIKKLSSMVDIITYEFENIPIKCLNYLEGKIQIFPSKFILSISQNRLNEKSHFIRSGINTPKFIKYNN